MTQTYISQDGQSIYDVCLNTYGTLNLLVKLITDNNFPNVDNYPVTRSAFQYDDTLTVNQTARATSGKISPYATRNTGVGSVSYRISESANGGIGVVTLTVPVAAGNQTTFSGIVDDGVHYDFNFIDAY